MKKVSKGFFLGSIASGLGLAMILILIGFVQIMNGNIESGQGLVLFSCIPMLYAAIVKLVLWYKMWAAIQDEHARTTPGKAIGFTFIPVFNFYWAFQVVWGFAKDYNKYVQRHNIDAQRIPEGLFLAYNILTVTALIPVLGLVCVIINYFIDVIIVWKICDAINMVATAQAEAIVSQSEAANKGIVQ